MPDAAKKKKRRPWQVDPSVYEGHGALSFAGRVFERLRSLGKIAIYGVLLIYPLILPIIGVAFGALVFWGTFGGSVLVFAILIAKFGLARNFDRRDFPLLKSLAGMCASFLCAVGFYLGLFYLSWLVLPLSAGLLGLIFFLVLRNKS